MRWAMNINTMPYWDMRFSSFDWDRCNGIAQSDYFTGLIMDNLPQSVKDDIRDNVLSAVDFGCAKGQLCARLKDAFPDNQIVGYDFSNEAVMQAQAMYPHLVFTNDLTGLEFDCVFCSNVLEHITDWMDQLFKFTQIAKRYVVVLVPHREYHLIPEHVVTFNEDSFPDILNGFAMGYSTVINTCGTGYWNGEQRLVIYAREAI
jgi:trans-aconitate methyltransferase